MKIVVNAQFLVENKLEGLGWFTYETLNRITKRHPEHTFYFIFSNKQYQQFLFSDNVIPIVVGPKQNHPLIWLVKFEIFIPFIIKKYKADLFFSPTGIFPLFSRIKTVSVLHDINFIHYPNHLSYSYRKYYNFIFPLFAKKAVRLATVSEFSKSDIAQQYSIDSSKIDVVYNGANENLSPISEEKKVKIRTQFTQGNPYFVFVGATPPRKNLINLFKAFDLFKLQNQNPYKLVLVGAKKWWSDEIRETYEQMKYREDVIFTGRVSTTDLNDLVASAEAMTYVSIFEGFGIPLLEAMWCETAIITSNCTSMPEVAKDAAVFVDPFSPQSIADGMQSLVSNPTLRNTLIANGRIRRQDFSWDLSAEKLWNCIEKAL
jgi:glycosyltransferase involved in cell wall biosynthesis